MCGPSMELSLSMSQAVEIAFCSLVSWSLPWASSLIPKEIVWQACEQESCRKLYHLSFPFAWLGRVASQLLELLRAGLGIYHV